MYGGNYEKSYNKWFMSGEKKSWGGKMMAEDKKKYKIAISMIDEGVLTDFDDVYLTGFCYDLKDICRIVDGTDIISVKGMYNQRCVYIIILMLCLVLVHTIIMINIIINRDYPIWA